MPFDRRDFVKSLTASLALPGMGAALPATAEAAMPAGARAAGDEKTSRPKAPNVIVMICDDLGYGDLGCYGSQLPTPHLDALAAGGVRMTRFNSAHPVCSASRAALLTGRYGHRMQTYGAFAPNSPIGTSLDETLLSNLFHTAGYGTKAIGKWHLGDKPEYLPTNRGFDSFYGVGYSDDYYPLPLLRDLTALDTDTDRDQLTPLYTAEAVKYIETRSTHKEQPFFLYLAFSYPHDPARASARFRGKTTFGDVGDCIAEIDWSVGEVVNAVERQGLSKDTLICFTSDHGPWYQGSPGGLRGRKGSAFEGGVRVPFIASWPGRIAAGKVEEAWHSNLDVLPALCTLCGLKAPEKQLDGVDMSGSLGGAAAAPQAAVRLYFCAMGNRGLDLHCIRKGKWKLRVAQGVQGEVYISDRSTAARASEWLKHAELYDLERDPAESYDVAKMHPEIVADLQKEIEAAMPSFPPEVVAAYTSLRQREGDISTPPGASPRPHVPNPVWSWEPEDRR